jgi:hypothetical protein
MTAIADPLARAVGEAVEGRSNRLFDLLARGSHLPGPRMNTELAEAFALVCRSLGARSDTLSRSMARLTADEAPGATVREFLPVCGVYAMAARAATDPSCRSAHLTALHALADDLRFRVRDAVVDGLARIGGAAGDGLVSQVAPWMDGYFHAAAVVRALGHSAWLASLHDGAPVVARLDDAFALARDAPRSAARWPGHKALMEALAASPGPIAVRFGVPIFDMLSRWAAVREPPLREVVARVLELPGLAGRFRPELDRARAALKASEPAPRNPDHDFGPSRDRSKNRQRGRRR